MRRWGRRCTSARTTTRSPSPSPRRRGERGAAAGAGDAAAGAPRRAPPPLAGAVPQPVRGAGQLPGGRPAHRGALGALLGERHGEGSAVGERVDLDAQRGALRGGGGAARLPLLALGLPGAPPAGRTGGDAGAAPAAGGDHLLSLPVRRERL